MRNKSRPPIDSAGSDIVVNVMQQFNQEKSTVNLQFRTENPIKHTAEAWTTQKKLQFMQINKQSKKPGKYQHGKIKSYLIKYTNPVLKESHFGDINFCVTRQFKIFIL